MKEELFARFLANDPQITSKDKAVNSRLSKARSVERDLDVDLDGIVNDNDRMYELLIRVKNELNDINGAKQNAVRKYYHCINGYEFPSMIQYKKMKCV